MHNQDFDKRFKQTERIAFVGVAISAIVSIGLVGFGIWVVVKLLGHFGVL